MIHINPSNILIELNHNVCVKIADFGISKFFPNIYTEKIKNEENATETQNLLYSIYNGTELYRAPEVITKKNYDYKVDIYSSGVTFLELLLISTYSTKDNFFELEHSICKLIKQRISAAEKFTQTIGNLIYLDDVHFPFLPTILKAMTHEDPEQRLEAKVLQKCFMLMIEKLFDMSQQTKQANIFSKYNLDKWNLKFLFQRKVLFTKDLF